jgi:hypothetical protein
MRGFFAARVRSRLSAAEAPSASGGAGILGVIAAPRCRGGENESDRARERVSPSSSVSVSSDERSDSSDSAGAGTLAVEIALADALAGSRAAVATVCCDGAVFVPTPDEPLAEGGRGVCAAPERLMAAAARARIDAACDRIERVGRLVD